MEFICKLELTAKYRKPENWDEEANQVVAEHFAYLTRLYQEGKIKWVGKTDLEVTDSNNMGLVVHVEETLEAVEERVLKDPCIQRGIMQFSIFPFRTIYA